MEKEIINHPTPLSYQEIMTATLPPLLAPARQAALLTGLPVEIFHQKMKPICPINFWHQLAFGGSEALAQFLAKAQICQCHEVMPIVYLFKQTRAHIEQFQTKFPGIIPPIFSEDVEKLMVARN